MNKTLITFFTVLFCLTSSVGWSLEYKDLVYLDGLYYKKFTDVPFTGDITGKKKGSFKNGKKDGSWISYHENGQLEFEGNYKNDKKEGSWVRYWDDGQLKFKGDYKNGRREGYWIVFSYDGQLWSKGKYKDGQMISD